MLSIIGKFHCTIPAHQWTNKFEYFIIIVVVVVIIIYVHGLGPSTCSERQLHLILDLPISLFFFVCNLHSSHSI